MENILQGIIFSIHEVLLFSTPSWALRCGARYNTGTRWVSVPSRAPACGWPWDIKRDSKETEKSTNKKQKCSAPVWKEDRRCRRAGNSTVPEVGYNLRCLLAAGRRSFMLISAPFLISLRLGRSLPCREIAGSLRCSSFSLCNPGRTATACLGRLERRALRGGWRKCCPLPLQLHSLTRAGAKELGKHRHNR